MLSGLYQGMFGLSEGGVKAVAGMVCTTTMICMGLALGHDGLMLATGIAAVGTMAGYSVGVTHGSN